MSERLRYRPPEEESRPLPKTADFRYTYRGYYDNGGVCRVRLFQDALRPPLILVSQLEENRNTSVTNMAEYLAAEIGARHFPERFEARDPFLFIEHYRYPEEKDPTLRETWSRVRFDSYTPRLVTLGGGGADEARHAALGPSATRCGDATGRAVGDGRSRGGGGMKRTWPWTVSLPVDREEWRRRHDARRVLLEKVRARRRLPMERRKAKPGT